ncbi:hypothetical protein ACQ4M4_02160 [Leptolyngbya sp. AN02str]
MELTNYSYPMRAAIRYKAKTQILAEQAKLTDSPTIDDALLRELASTVFRSERGKAVFCAYPTHAEAEDIENRFAAELVVAYQMIQRNQAEPLVQRLNQLL